MSLSAMQILLLQGILKPRFGAGEVLCTKFMLIDFLMVTKKTMLKPPAHL